MISESDLCCPVVVLPCCLPVFASKRMVTVKLQSKSCSKIAYISVLEDIVKKNEP